MIVARQFIAWYPCENGNRPVGHGMIGSDRRATIRAISQPRGKDQTVPYGTDSQLNGFQAIAANLSGLETGGYMLVIVRLDAGKATEVRALMSSGSLIADKEICQFVLDHWVFNPKATGVYKLPVLLRAGL
jgi:hypothetical protein